MDEHIAYVSRGDHLNSPRRIRTSSFQSQPSSPRQRLRDRTFSRLSIDSQTVDKPQILAPTPRRHLLETSESQHWLKTPPLSPISSRAQSPIFPHFGHASFTQKVDEPRGRHLSFNSLAELDKVQEMDAPRATVEQKIPPPASEGEMGMGKRWIRWMHKQGMKQWVIPWVILASGCAKWCIGLGSYSGQGTPPMYGDYEAQRHWMELTIHLPVRQWYTYDLQYWGLDYPPLTAYVSWLCGSIGSWFIPSAFALRQSRGTETEESKVFMRWTVLALDAMVYVPAVYMFVRTWLGNRSGRTQNLAFLMFLSQPGLLLIDFGHFQYNTVMLGFTLLAVNFFATGHDLWGALCFVLSLGFKQMALYYAPAVGSYLLGKCLYLGPSRGTRLFTYLALVTLLTFSLLFLPFLPPFSPMSGILDPITRIFPFNRGLFEDKVANFWCATNVIFKWRKWGSRAKLVKLSAGLTALGFAPAVFVLIRGGFKLRPKEKQDDTEAHTPILPLLPYALLTSSMSFFLFSFQVHEKTILVPLLPMNLLMCGAPADSNIFAWGALLNNVSVFSMWPLLKKDGLVLQSFAMLLLWNRLIGYTPFRLKDNRSFVQLLSIGCYSAAVVLVLLEMLTAPPARYPDIFAVLNVLVCTPVFGLVWLWSIKCSMEVGWALAGPYKDK